MRLNDRAKMILMGVLEDQKRLAAMSLAANGGMSREARGRRRLLILRAREGKVPLALEDWLGRAPTNSDRVLFCRECRRLEGMGLLVRCNDFGGRRTTHLKLTPQGRRAAERVLAEEYGLDGDEGIDWSNVEFMPIEMPEEPQDPVLDREEGR